MQKTIFSIIKCGICGAALALVEVGCKAPQVASLPTPKQMPTVISNTTVADTTSMAEIPWQQFFPDEKLLALIDTAIANNPDLKIAEQKINIAGAYLLRSNAALLPTITADLTASGTKYGKYTMEGVGNYDTNLSDNIDDKQKTPTSPTPNYWLGLNASWEADIWGKLKDAKAADKAGYLASFEAKQFIYASLVSQVAGLYYNLQGLDQEKVIVKNNIALQQKALKTVEILKNGGRANELAVQQFKAQLLNTKSVATELNQKIVATENQLNALLGRFNDTVYRSNRLIPVSEDNIKIGFSNSLLQNRPDIRFAALQLEAQKANVQAVRKAFFPSLKISGYAAFNAFKGGLLFDPGSFVYALAGGISAPVFQRGQLQSMFNIASAEQESAFWEYQGKVINAYQEVATAVKQLETNKSKYAQKQQEVQALKSSITAANDLYVGGYANYLEIISAQKNVLNAELELVHSQRDILLALVDIYRALGGGWIRPK